MEELIYLGSKVLALVCEAPTNKQHVVSVVKPFLDKFLKVSGYDYTRHHHNDDVLLVNSYQVVHHFLNTLNRYVIFEDNPDEVFNVVDEVMVFFGMTIGDLI